MTDAHTYSATTDDIIVNVSPRYLEDQSKPAESHYVWAYSVEIINTSGETIQLKERSWIITDANGVVEKVHGPGVVGEQPILKSGDSYHYSSGCPLSTPSGIMVGSYLMIGERGQSIDVAIPAFSLDLPHARVTVN
jgi:ApaG protein